MKNIELLTISLILINYICHLSIDFIFQTNNIVEQKKTSYTFMLKKHIIPGFLFNIAYLVIFNILIQWEKQDDLLQTIVVFCLGSAIIWLLHIGLDITKVKIIKSKMSNYIHVDWISYILDQGIHFLIIYIISYYESNLVRNSNVLSITNYNKNLLSLSVLICTIILITRFTQFLIQKILQKHFNDNTDTDNKTLASGTSIGVIERLLILFAVIEQSLFTPIIAGIIALKSVTRFEKINKDSKYAEYYLLGSLISMLSALVFSTIGIYIIKMILKIEK